MKNELDKLSEKIKDNDTVESNPNFKKWDELDDNYNDEINKLEDIYFKLPQSEKEKFAHNYAKRQKERLIKNGKIPFERKE